jgi:hypothetical protein
MSMISKIGEALASSEDKVKAAIPKSGWMSRKLWIFAGIAMGLIWLGRDDMVRIIDGILWLTAVYLICQTLQDVASDFCNAWVQRGKDRADTDVKIALHEAPITSEKDA